MSSLEAQQDEQAPKKLDIETAFNDAVVEMGLETVVKFEGFYHKDSNARAKTSVGAKVSFNERNLGITPLEEYERISWHELQHVRNDVEVLAFEDDVAPTWAFSFHEDLNGLFERMRLFHEKHKENGYPFVKSLPARPTNYDEMQSPQTNYFHPDELLAILRGYEVYLRQQESSPESVPHQPYEFIDAFEPKDLKLLGRNYRKKLAEEVLERTPEVTPSNDNEEIDVTWGDLEEDIG